MIEIIRSGHPIVVHCTVALLALSVIIHVLARVLPTGRLQTEANVFARWSLRLGTGFAALTVVSGGFAYNSVAHDAASHAAMQVHRNWALATMLAFVAGGALAATAWRGADVRHAGYATAHGRA